MQTEIAEMAKASPFKAIIDIVIAPKEALEQLRLSPTWGWALALTLVLASAGSYLMTPALLHAFETGWPAMVAKTPTLAALSADQQQAQLAFLEKVYHFAWLATLFTLPIGILIQTLVMTIFNKIGRGEGTFGRFWAVACNIAVPTVGLGSIVGAIVVIMHGAENFNTMQSLQGAIPSLAMLAPGAGPKVVGALGAIQPFSLWAAGLATAAMLIVGRVPRIHAWLSGATLLLLPAILAFAFAR